MDFIFCDELITRDAPPTKTSEEEHKDLLAKLNSEEFKSFLKLKLGTHLNHPILSQPRVFLPSRNDLVKKGEPIPKKRKTYAVGVEKINHEIKTKKVSFSEKSYTELKTPATPWFTKDFYQKNLGHTNSFYHDGVIAGGAIAALVNEFINKVPAVINDIDYFYYANFRFKNHKELENSLYINFGNEEEAFSIVKSQKEGIFNFIKVSNPSGNKKIWDNLLSTFDLNATAVWVHPLTLEVSCTPEFASFINTRTIDHLNEFNLTNIIRAQRKALELQAKYYLKDNLYHSLLQGSYFIPYMLKDHKIPLTGQEFWRGDVNFLAEKDLAAFKTYPELFSPWFSYEHKTNTLKYTQGFPLIEFYAAYNDKFPERSVMDVSKIRNLITILRQINPNYPRQEVQFIYYDRLLTLMEAFTFFEIDLGDTNLSATSLNLIKKFLKSSIHRDSLISLVNKIQGHSSLLWGFLALLNSNWSFTDADLFLRRVVNLGDEAIGILEPILNQFRKTSKYDYRLGAETIKINLSRTKGNDFYNLFLSILRKIREYNSQEDFLREKKDLGNFSKYVVELTTVSELNEEGKKMRHCIAGRVQFVRENSSRIFHLSIGGEESTLEISGDTWRAVYNKPHFIKEHRLFANANPGPKSKALANLLINKLTLNS